MALDFSIKTIIEQKLNEIETEFQRAQGLILTEDDLKCLLYRKLMEIDELAQTKQTRNKEICANSVHTEVVWYDKEKKLTIRPDITIIEPENLRILDTLGNYKCKLSSKTYSFTGKTFIFELKFIRNKTGIRPATVRSKIKKDYEKIKKLFGKLDSQQAGNDIFCYFVIFNKTDLKCRVFDEFIDKNEQSYRHKYIYGTGKVIFNSLKKRKSR